MRHVNALDQWRKRPCWNGATRDPIRRPKCKWEGHGDDAHLNEVTQVHRRAVQYDSLSQDTSGSNTPRRIASLLSGLCSAGYTVYSGFLQ